MMSIYSDHELIKQQKKRIAELEVELAILKADNDNWRKHGTSLNEIQAAAIEEAGEHLRAFMAFGDRLEPVLDYLNFYANQLRS